MAACVISGRWIAVTSVVAVMVLGGGAACGQWEQLHKLTADDAATGDRFGWSVASCGDHAIVGVSHDDDAGSESGSAYVFDVITGEQLHKLTADDAAEGDWFGVSVGISGDLTIVGAYYDDDAPYADSGSAYVFDVITGEQLHKLTADDAAEGDWFGISVGISGDLAIVGAPYNDVAGSNSGSAYVFDVITGEQLHKLTADDAVAGDCLGVSVGISGDLAIVGAYYDDDAGSESGSAYVFDATTGDQLHKLTADDAAADDRFGYSVAISDDLAIVGAHGDDDAVSTSGSAYVFSGSDPDGDGIFDPIDNCPNHYNPEQADCDGDGVGDVCTIIECDGSTWCDDCNENGVPDECDIADGTSGDCNENGIPDECELADGSSFDCNDNGILDECDIADGTSEDCQPNGIPDECDIADGTSEDWDGDGIPNECDCIGDVIEDGVVDVTDLLVLLSKWGPCPPEGPCLGDVNGSGEVDVVDLLLLLGAWGPCEEQPPPCPWDFNGDGFVDDFDMDILVEHWGDCPDPPEECPWDFTDDGCVSVLDMNVVYRQYGQCPG